MGKPSARRNHRTTLPQSRPCGRDSSLREGAGVGCVPFNRVLAKIRGFGRFSSPLRNSKTVSFYHSSKYTPSVSHSLDSSLREGAGRAVPFIVPVGNRKVAGDFHRPYETQKPFPFTIHRSTLPQSRFARQLPQRGSREGVRTIQRAARKPQRCGRFSSPLRKLRGGDILPFKKLA